LSGKIKIVGDGTDVARADANNTAITKWSYGRFPVGVCV
jgi:hypothetical protein